MQWRVEQLATLPREDGFRLREALRRVPTFILCFVLLAMFWSAHKRWSRRFGLDDLASTIWSLGLVLVMLVYVYPLRMVVSSGLWLATGGFGAMAASLALPAVPPERFTYLLSGLPMFAYPVLGVAIPAYGKWRERLRPELV